jgi:hypothetical protein
MDIIRDIDACRSACVLQQTPALPGSSSKRPRIPAQAQFGPASITDNLSVSV